MGTRLDQDFLDFLDADRELLDEFASWLGANEVGTDATVADADVFTVWRRLHSTGVLDAFDENDVVEFLLDWCPRKYLVDPDHMCASVGAFLEFLADTGRLAGGAERAAQLARLATHVAPAMRATDGPGGRAAKAVFKHPMANRPGKPSYAELLAQGTLSEKELEAELESRIADYCELPERERDALTARFHAEEDAVAAGHLIEEQEPVELPFVYIPPPAAEVDAVAAGAPLLQKIDALRDYLGESGKPLTQRGNLKLADGKALIDLLDTGDEMEMEFEDRTSRKNTTERLPGLNSIVNIAKEAGAVRIHQHKLVPVKTWSRRSATERATALYRAIIELGALGSRGASYELLNTVDDVLDDGTVHWLAGLLDPDLEADFDRIVDAVEPVLLGEIEPYWPQWSEGVEGMAQHGISQIVETLEAAGVVEWSGRGQTKFGSSTIPTGGTIRLTALGRHVVPDSLEEAGYTLRRVDDLLDGPASALIDALDSVPDDQRQIVADAWQPTVDTAGRVRQIVDFVGAAEDPASRLRGFAALELFDDAVVGPQMSVLLDGPTAGHAALYMLSRGLVDEAEVAGLIDIGVFVDVLAASLDDPDELCEMFSEAPHTGDQYNALEQMVRHPAPETELVLDALGQHLSDKKLAKAARKAAMRHRSWMANRT
jgi:hypothetical protein